MSVDVGTQRAALNYSLSSRGALATKDLGNIAQLKVDVLEILRFALDDK